jgi:hypothetical protein
VGSVEKFINENLRAFLVPLDSLIPDPKNARQHDDRNVAVIMESLTQFGQQTPIIYTKDDRVVIKGNATLEAAKRLGWGKVAAIPFDRDAIKAAGYKLTDNRSSDLSEWGPLLRDSLEELVGWGVDLDAIGWASEELADIIRDPQILESIGIPNIENSLRECTFILSEAQYLTVSEAIREAKKKAGEPEEDNENTNGNGLASVCRFYLQAAKV